jgi:RHS repeat-associated protein
MRATSLTATGPANRTFRTAPRRGRDRQDRATHSPALKSKDWTKRRGPITGISSNPYDIAQGPDGNMWLIDEDNPAAGVPTIDKITSGTSTTRAYTFDADSNRTSLTTTTSSTACGSTQCVATQDNAYDQADRLDDSGITYDPFGDVTTMPWVDAGGTTLRPIYYSDGTDNTLTQGSTEVTNNLDPDERTSEQITAVNGTTTHDVLNYYDNDGTSPAYDLDQTTNTEDRYIPDISGNTTAIWTDNENTNTASFTYQLNNFQGSIVAQASGATGTTGLESATPVTEYGVPTTATPAKYSWLGGKERDTELASGIVAMGARVYDPYTGTFLQPDPIPGADANNYGYTDGDPVNETDLTGERSIISDAWHAAEHITIHTVKDAAVAVRFVGQVVSVAGKAVGEPVADAGGELLRQGAEYLLNSVERFNAINRINRAFGTGSNELETDIFGNLKEIGGDAVKGAVDAADGAADVAQGCADDTGEPC